MCRTSHIRLMTVSLLVFLIVPIQSYAVVTYDNDDFDIPELVYDEEGDYVWSDGAYFMSIYQLRKLLDLNWLLRKVGVLPNEEAENVNEWDEVPDSTWFTNRHAFQRMSQEDLARGPGSGAPPSGPWTVIKGKALGINPGFVARDQQGRLLFVKLDPPNFPGMGTNADVLVSRFLYAVGYNVPEYYQVVINSDSLALSPEATIPGKYKVIRPTTQDDLEDILSKAPEDSHGRLFGDVSIGLPGKPKGPFNFLGVRKDDPNDTVRHENRRELRGLRVIMAWLNNTDSRRGNSLDMYVEEAGRRFSRHYLIDFSGSLGSGNNIPKEKEQGHEYFFDPGIVTGSLGALGIWVRPWERKEPAMYPEIGLFESKTFEPQKWRGSYANPAFEKMTARDAFWGAKIVTSFTDEDIRTIVHTGYFPTPGAEDYLVKTLIERRDMIGKYWFNIKKINPLDNFTVQTLPDGSQELLFSDLAVERGYADRIATRYRYRLDSGKYKVTQDSRIPLPKAQETVLIHMKTSRDAGKRWGRSLSVLLESDAGKLRVKHLGR